MRRWDAPRWETVAAFGAVIAGTAIRSWQIRYSFDGDEAFSVTLASRSFAQTIIGSLADTPHPPLHNILLHIWMSLFGTSEPAARSLSVAFSCGFLFLTYRIARRYLDPWLSFGVTLIAALSPLFVYFGQQARPYALVAFLSAANLAAFLRALDSPQEKWPVRVWALSGVALVYSHYLGVLFIGCQLVWAMFALKTGRRRLLVHGLAAMVSIVPWLLAAMGPAMARHGNPVPQITWIGPPHADDLVRFYVHTIGERFPTRWLLVILLAAAIAYGLRVYRTRQVPPEHLLLLILAFGLPLFAFAESAWGPRPVFVDRQLVGAALTFVVMVGVAAAALPRPLAAAMLAVLVTWSAMSVRMYLPDRINPPWRDASSWIEQHYGGEPLVADEPSFQDHLSFYRRTGHALLWRDLSSAVKSNEFLYACRPFRCSALGELKARGALVKTWHWNFVAGNTRFNQLRLYAIQAKAPAPI